MSRYEYWKCSEREDKEGFGVKDIVNNTYYAGDEVIDLINQLSIKANKFEEAYNDEKKKTISYKKVLKDLINGDYIK